MADRIVPFLETARTKYRRYARRVLGFRHFCEMRDGMLPVRRRAIWATYKLGATSDQRAVTSAKVVGDCLGDLHPHNPLAIYGAVVNMSQAHTSAPCFLGIGNWGNTDDPPGDMRYTKCFLSPYTLTMLDPDELACVPSDPTYDGKHEEPRFLPVHLPHLLLAGCVSLAPGYNGNIPPCAPDWVAHAVAAVVAGKRPASPRRMAYRWGGTMLSLDADWLSKGTGSAEFAPESRIEGQQLIISTLAPRLNVEGLEKRLSKYDHFAGLTAEAPTGSDIVRIVARVSRGGSPTDLQSCLGTTREHFNMIHVAQFMTKESDIDYNPMHDSPIGFLARWIKWRKSVVVAAANHRADKLRAEVRRLTLLARACDLLTELWKIIKSAKDAEEIRRKTMSLLRCTSEEATVVMAIPWSRLAKFEKAQLLAKAAEHTQQIKIEMGIVSQPMPRLTSDAESAAVALQQTLQDAAAMRTNRTERKRRA